ncbi:MAG TPA: hypothetical protein VGL63_07440 [Streptosporangiaceae bacterium]
MSGRAGTGWTVMAVPLPSDSINSYLSGVSCRTATDCAAVGSYGLFNQDTGLFAERWNGSRWTVQVLPHPAAAAFALTAVSCSSGRSCTAGGAAGGVQVNTYSTATAESWDGTTWTEQTTPVPPKTIGSELNGVSCLGPRVLHNRGGR